MEKGTEEMLNEEAACDKDLELQNNSPSLFCFTLVYILSWSILR